MNRSSEVYLKDIMESISAIEEFSKNMKKEELLSNRMKQSAIIREFEIIGEATKNIPNEFKISNNHVPWKEMAGMRDVIIHSYFKVDLDAVWNAIKKDIPFLKKEITKLLI